MEKYESNSASTSVSVQFRYTYNYAHAHIDDVRTYGQIAPFDSLKYVRAENAP